MAVYQTGTCSVTSGTNAVTGTGTAFTTNVGVGDSFKFLGENAIYQVIAVTNDTSLQISPSYAGTTKANVAFQIMQLGSRTLNLGLAEITTGLQDWPYWMTNEVIRKIDSNVASSASPAFSGIPTAPTAPASTNTAQLATTAFVIGQAGTATPASPTTSGTVGTSYLYSRQDHAHPTDTSRAPLASPTFTGTATSPTFTSTVATGTAPLVVASTTKVSNLNADLLDGFNASQTPGPNQIPVLDNNGNLGIGVTPSPWNSVDKAIDLSTQGAIFGSAYGVSLNANSYTNSSGVSTYKTTGAASQFQCTNGGHYWYTAPSGAAGSSISWITAMSLDGSGNLSVNGGFTTGQENQVIKFPGNTNATGTYGRIQAFNTSYSYPVCEVLFDRPAANTGDIVFRTGAAGAIADRVRISNTGNLYVGVTTGTSHQIDKNVSENTSVLLLSSGGSTFTVFNYAAGGGANGSAAALYVNKNSTTSRSINAAGTLNASGADYAEYETKSAICGIVAKGQIVGFDTNGLVTDRWAEAISFGVKSTNPNLVGGDTWGAEDVVGKKPEQPVYEPPAYTGSTDPGPEPTQVTAEWTAAKQQYDTDQAAYTVTVKASEDAYATAMTQYQTELAAWEAVLEAARQKVDRIAYSGKVPVNITGANPGDYIIAVIATDGVGIAGQAVAAPAFEQYQKVVGRVRKILTDGRAEIVVIMH